MPTYTYRCAKCGVQEDAIRKIDERDAPLVGVCGHSMGRTLTAPALRKGQPAYSHARADAVTAELLGLHSVSEVPPGLRADRSELAKQ